MPNYGKTRKAALEAVIKEQVSETVDRIIKEHAPQKISIGMVAAEMGISPATLYKIFKNKANLMAYVIVQYYKPFAEKAQKIVDSDMSIAEKLRALAEYNLRITSESNQEIATLYNLSSANTLRSVNEAEQAREQTMQRIVDIMKDGIRQGVLRKASPLELALGFSGIVQSYGGYLLQDKKHGSIEDLAKNIVTLFLDGATAKKR